MVDRKGLYDDTDLRFLTGYGTTYDLPYAVDHVTSPLFNEKAFPSKITSTLGCVQRIATTRRERERDRIGRDRSHQQYVCAAVLRRPQTVQGGMSGVGGYYQTKRVF